MRFSEFKDEHSTIFLKKTSDILVQILYKCTIEDDRAANQRSAFSLFFTLAVYFSNGFGLNQTGNDLSRATRTPINCNIK